LAFGTTARDDARMGRVQPAAAPALLCVLAATSLLDAGVSQSVAAVLIANDAMYARLSDASGATLQEDVQPPGIVSNASLAVNFASLSCSLTTTSGEHLLSISHSAFNAHPNRSEVHADVTLWLLGPASRSIGVDVLVDHGGDFADANGVRVDVGDDGSDEVWSACGFTCQFVTNHRGFHWSFADGPLPIRVRADQAAIFGAQGYGLQLRVRPWIPGATPETDDCGGVAWHGPDISPTSTNAHLFAEQSTQPNELCTLRAMGFGNFGAFLVSTAPATMTLTLPPPFSTTCDVLAFSFADAPGSVSESILLSAQPPMPREWLLPVPTLPPNLTLYVQHASAEPTALVPGYNQPWFGTSNVIRIDT